eukprot:gene8494-10090_t
MSQSMKDRKAKLKTSWDFQEEHLNVAKTNRRPEGFEIPAGAVRGEKTRVSDAVQDDRVLPDMHKPVFVPVKKYAQQWHGADI